MYSVHVLRITDSPEYSPEIVKRNKLTNILFQPYTPTLILIKNCRLFFIPSYPLFNDFLNQIRSYKIIQTQPFLQQYTRLRFFLRFINISNIYLYISTN